MPRRLIALEGNTQRLDGGAMFGNCPRALWERWIAPDDRHRIPLACRGLLVDEGDRLVLFETGVGAFFEPELRDRYGVVEDRHVLLDSLAAHGLSHEDVQVVVLSHLHFDHAGGLLTPYRDGAQPELLFPRARFVVGRRAWERARAPHPRDRASFIPELPELLERSGRLEIVDGERAESLGPGYRFFVSDGHTPGMLVSEIDTGRGPLVFAADLIPGRPWTHLPITMGYDRFAERVIDEKRELLDDLHARRGALFFTHDATTPFARPARDERGRFQAVPVDAGGFGG
ncbi:MAG: MBL fold metallo-hydrolase [Acidobacteriota bacterium]